MTGVPLLHFTTNTAIAVREITHNSKQYLVAPVVALKAGVVNGYYVPQDELAKFVESWNGRPVPLHHPQANGQYISANSPDLWTKTPGFLWNTHMDGDALKGEVWIDLEKAQKLGGDAVVVVQRLRANQPVEVSTGYFADIVAGKGLYNGKQYDGVHRNIRPDHLALLPNEIGACNWQDGCGVPRVNQKGTRMPNETVTTNELALDDRLHLIRRAFRDQMKANPMEEPWDFDVIGVFDAYIIAKDWQAKSHTAYSYTISDDGEVTFGDPAPVDVVYRAKDGGAEVVVANAGNQEQQERGLFRRFVDWWNQLEPDLQTNGNGSGAGHRNSRGAANSQKDNAMTKDELVTALVANKRCKFGKEVLEGWEEGDLQTLQESLAQGAPVSEPEPEPQATTVELPAEITQFAQVIANLGGAEKLGEALGQITANADQERTRLIEAITANERNSFEDAELQALATPQLRKLASVLAPRDYTGAAGAFYNGHEAEEEVLQMPAAWPEEGGN